MPLEPYGPPDAHYTLTASVSGAGEEGGRVYTGEVYPGQIWPDSSETRHKCRVPGPNYETGLNRASIEPQD